MILWISERGSDLKLKTTQINIIQAFLFLLLIIVTILILIPVQKRIDQRILEIKNQTISIIEEKLNRKISYSTISPSLFMYMEFRDFSILDNGRELININRIRIYYNLMDVLSGNALNSLKEVRIVKSEFTFDYEEDKELLDLFKTDAKNEKTDINFPEIKISGRNLKIKLIKGTESIQFSRLFFNLIHKNKQFQLNTKGNLRTVIGQFESATGSAKFIFSGTLSDNLDLFNTRIVLKSIETSIVSIKKLSLRASYKDGIFDIRKVEDARPLDLRIIYSTINRQLTGNFTSENFIPLDYFTPKKIDPSILQWLSTSVTGNSEFIYSIDTADFSYSAELEALTNNELLPVQALLDISLTGNRESVVFSKFKAVTRDGTISFRGEVEYDNLLPSGNLYLSYNLINTKINADMIIRREDSSLIVSGRNITINDIKLFNFHSEIVFFENDTDFQVSFGLFDADDHSLLNDDIVSIDGNLQHNPDFFLNLAINTVNTPVNSLVRIIPSKIESFFEVIPKLSLDSELFISTDFEQFSFSAGQIKLSSDSGDQIIFSTFGNNESIEINNISVNWNDKYLVGSIKAGMSGRSIIVNADVVYEELPYTLNLSYYPGTGIFFEGSYGLSGSLFKLGNVSEFRLSILDLPIPTGENISWISLDTDGYFNNFENWLVSVDSLSISNIPGLTAENTLNLNGYISEDKISLTAINYTDPLSSLIGSADFNYNISENRELEGNFSLHSLEEELYEGTISLLDKEIIFEAAFNNAPLDRFNNVPLSGYLNGELSLDGFLPEPNISMTLQLEKGAFNSSPLEIETSIEFYENNLQLNYFRLNYMDQILQKGKGEYNLNTGEFLLTTEYLGIFDKKNLNASIQIKGSSISFSSRPEISEIFTNNYFLLFSFSNILVDAESSNPWEFQIERNNKIISFKGGPEESLSGSIDDNGSFNIISKKGLPIRGEAEGSIADSLIDLRMNNLEVDLELVNLLPIGSIFELLDGTASGYLNVSGEITDPVFNGILHAVDAKSNVFMVPEEVEPFNTNIIFRNRNITIGPKDLHISNSTAKIEASFIISKWALSTFSLDIKTLGNEGLHIIYDVPSIGLGLDGFITGGLNINGNEYGIYINSDLIVDDCIISLGPGTPDTSTGNIPIFTDMKFTSGRKVQFLWPSNTLPILRATANIGQTITFTMDNLSRTYSVIGDIDIKHGSIYYFQKSFYLSEGLLTFNENEAKFDPLLDFRAQIKEVDAEGEIVNISLILDKMPVSQFAPRFESDPPLSDVEIFSILGSSVFTNIGTEQIDLTSALLLTGDLVTQFGIIRNFENKVKDIFKLDLFSIRTQMIQNILIDRFIDDSSTNQDVYMDSFGRYLDNTTLYLGKYFGDDIFLQALVQISTQKILESDQLYATNELFIESTVSLEWQTPFFLLGFSVKPDFIDPVSSIQNTSLELSWGYSY